MEAAGTILGCLLIIYDTKFIGIKKEKYSQPDFKSGAFKTKKKKKLRGKREI